MRTIEIYAGLALICFAAASAVSWVVLRRVLENPAFLPADASRALWVAVLHDTGYLVCAPIFALVASRLIAGGRWTAAVVLVPANYFIEEIFVFAMGEERVYWDPPWGFLGRAAVIAVTFALCLLASRRNRRPVENVAKNGAST
jgi:hypothetical protein